MSILVTYITCCLEFSQKRVITDVLSGQNVWVVHFRETALGLAGSVWIKELGLWAKRLYH